MPDNIHFNLLPIVDGYIVEFWCGNSIESQKIAETVYFSRTEALDDALKFIRHKAMAHFDSVKCRIYDLAESYRLKLGLKPWHEFEKEMLKRWSGELNLTPEARFHYIQSKRQCGKTTKFILERLAEAVITQKPLIVCGVTETHTGHLLTRTKNLAEKLELELLIERSLKQAVLFSESYFD